jgi:hypothetical protein
MEREEVKDHEGKRIYVNCIDNNGELKKQEFYNDEFQTECYYVNNKIKKIVNYRWNYAEYCWYVHGDYILFDDKGNICHHYFYGEETKILYFNSRLY